MRIGPAAVLLIVVFCLCWPGSAGARRVDASLEIPVHPQVATNLHLPDAVERARVYHGGHHPGKIDTTYAGSTVHVRPRPDTPAGADAMLEVQTRTVRLTFWLRVVENAGDAREDVLVMIKEAERPAEEVAPGRDDAARAPASPPAPVPPVPELSLAPPRSLFDLSVHGIAALPGFTSLGVAGYNSQSGVRPHLMLGARFAGAPPGTWWAIEAGILWEWLIFPVELDRPTRDRGQTELLQIGGSLLRMEVGFRGHLEAMWTPSLYAGIGMQAHFDRKSLSLIMGKGSQPIRATSDMTYAAVVALGLGVQRQLGDVLLGLDVQMRQGVPADYRSVDVVLSVGCFLDDRE